MGPHSKTGLLPTNKKVTIKYETKRLPNLKAEAVKAPYTLKPFAGLYNPYPHGCSLLCNHPADTETKNLLKKAKDTWTIEGKPLLLVEEISAIRATLEQIHTSAEDDPGKSFETVPEELFRRYTETDSRPLTPAPTVISNYTKTSGIARRCVTPDPIPKTQLILDLRRSHSQETLSWFGGGASNLSEQPIINIQQVPKVQHSESPLLGIQDKINSVQSVGKHTVRPKMKMDNFKLKPEINHSPKSGLKKSDVVPPKIILDDVEKIVEDEKVDEEENIIKRRGKKRHKKGRDSSRGPLPVQGSIDPETQIATIGINSLNTSARPSLVPNVEIEDIFSPKPIEMRKTSLDVDSYLNKDILRQLRRELNEEIVDNEFNLKRRKALEEAMKTLRREKRDCDELKSLQKELKIPKIDQDFWLSLPRMFSRSSSRFELPVDSRMFTTMTPIDYLKDHVTVTTSRRLLYNCIFNRNKTEFEFEEEYIREIPGKNLRKALNEMMGKSLTEKQFEEFSTLVGWKDEDNFDFKTFSGICALCERLLGPEYYPLAKEEDPRQEIESIDFESLKRRIGDQSVDPRLLKIMYRIRDS